MDMQKGRKKGQRGAGGGARLNGGGRRTPQLAGVKGYKLGARVGGQGGAFLDVGDDGDEVPFVFMQFEEDQRGHERAVVQRLDTGEVGMLPDWGLIRTKLQTARQVPNPDPRKRKAEPTVEAPAKRGDAFVLMTRGREKLTKGKWRGKKAVALDLFALERGR